MITLGNEIQELQNSPHNLSVENLAKLLNISTEQLLELEREDIKKTRPGMFCLFSRTLLLFRKLSSIMTGKEIMAWLEKPHSHLANKPPIDCLRDMESNQQYMKVSALVENVVEPVREEIRRIKYDARLRISDYRM